jgi:hypothetical protein
MNTNSKFGLAFALALAGCGSAHEDAGSSSDQAITSGEPSGYAECPGLGWTSSIRERNGVAGSYMRLGLTPPDEFSQLTVFENPSEENRGALPYLRTWKSLPDSGKAAFGTDNPAIGPAIGFANDDFSQIKELYWVLGQQHSASGKLRAMCLGKASDSDGKPDPDAKPFMLTRLGL